MYFASAVPSIAVERRMNLEALVTARGRGEGRLAWSAIFAKAFAVVAQEMPELRRTYLAVPWSHLYDTPGAWPSLPSNANMPASAPCWGV